MPVPSSLNGNIPEAIGSALINSFSATDIGTLAGAATGFPGASTVGGFVGAGVDAVGATNSSNSADINFHNPYPGIFPSQKSGLGLVRQTRW